MRKVLFALTALAAFAFAPSDGAFAARDIDDPVDEMAFAIYTDIFIDHADKWLIGRTIYLDGEDGVELCTYYADGEVMQDASIAGDAYLLRYKSKKSDARRGDIVKRYGKPDKDENGTMHYSYRNGTHELWFAISGDRVIEHGINCVVTGIGSELPKDFASQFEYR